jgi:preprotein translocase subunit YajC
MQPGAGGGIAGFLPLIFIFVIFYFLLIRPQQKRMKEHQKTLDNLQKGDQVITSGGIHGTVANIRGAEVDIKVAEDIRMVFSKDAISTVKKDNKEAVIPAPTQK